MSEVTHVNKPEGWAGGSFYRGLGSQVLVSHAYDGWYWYKLCSSDVIEDGDVLICRHSGLAKAVAHSSTKFMTTVKRVKGFDLYRKISKVPKKKKKRKPKVRVEVYLKESTMRELAKMKSKSPMKTACAQAVQKLDAGKRKAAKIAELEAELSRLKGQQ
jgi:hypothetical protein